MNRGALMREINERSDEIQNWNPYFPSWFVMDDEQDGLGPTEGSQSKDGGHLGMQAPGYVGKDLFLNDAMEVQHAFKSDTHLLSQMQSSEVAEPKVNRPVGTEEAMDHMGSMMQEPMHTDQAPGGFTTHTPVPHTPSDTPFNSRDPNFSQHMHGQKTFTEVENTQRVMAYDEEKDDDKIEDDPFSDHYAFVAAVNAVDNPPLKVKVQGIFDDFMTGKASETEFLHRMEELDEFNSRDRHTLYNAAEALVLREDKNYLFYSKLKGPTAFATMENAAKQTRKSRKTDLGGYSRSMEGSPRRKTMDPITGFQVQQFRSNSLSPQGFTFQPLEGALIVEPTSERKQPRLSRSDQKKRKKAQSKKTDSSIDPSNIIETKRQSQKKLPFSPSK
jgi:hypothetical protein